MRTGGQSSPSQSDLPKCSVHAFVHSGYLYSATSRNLLRDALSPAMAKKKCTRYSLGRFCMVLYKWPCTYFTYIAELGRVVDDIRLLLLLLFIHSFIHCRHLYSASSSGA